VSSCDTDAGSTHGFPHLITQELIREVRNPRADAGTAHVADDDGRFGIHYTSQVYAGSQDPAGSFAFVVARDGSRAAYRLGDARDAAVDLTQARRIRRLTRPTN
jgi:hypothetical protein